MTGKEGWIRFVTNIDWFLPRDRKLGLFIWIEAWIRFVTTIDTFLLKESGN